MLECEKRITHWQLGSLRREECTREDTFSKEVLEDGREAGVQGAPCHARDHTDFNGIRLQEVIRDIELWLRVASRVRHCQSY